MYHLSVLYRSTHIYAAYVYVCVYRYICMGVPGTDIHKLDYPRVLNTEDTGTSLNHE